MHGYHIITYRNGQTLFQRRSQRPEVDLIVVDLINDRYLHVCLALVLFLKSNYISVLSSQLQLVCM